MVKRGRHAVSFFCAVRPGPRRLVFRPGRGAWQRHLFALSAARHRYQLATVR